MEIISFNDSVNLYSRYIFRLINDVDNLVHVQDPVELPFQK